MIQESILNKNVACGKKLNAHVAMTVMGDRKTENREYHPLEQIRDNWSKFVVTRSGPIQRRGCIVHENVTELIRGAFELAREGVQMGIGPNRFYLS